ncbi:sensor histidine kinase [Ahniella affigens]|uniref:Sensor histidine kinase n=2 Tax=Ahniella affigens TaxID=2021234 RepID=A0A2P1PV96_9GAMM|nr:sensor histidine kinase [Ahniella affigens]
MPDFCSVPVLASLILIVELVVAVIVIAPDQARVLPRLQEFLAASFAAQWIALLSAVLLCKLGPLLAHLRQTLSIALALLIPVLIAIFGGTMLGKLDHSLNLHLLSPATSLPQFVLGLALLSLLTGIVVMRYFFVQERWKRQVAAQARAQLDALHARIRPHFLFNTLNTAASLIEIAPRQAEQAILDLADLFRAALAPETKEWPLAEEFALTRRYLEIEQLRLGPRLAIVLDLPHELEQTLVPQLCLQPLVENAIHHGIQALAEGGQVHVEARQTAGSLLITVLNPKPRQGLNPALSRGNHVALGNIRDRLRLRYAERAELLAVDQGDHYRVTLRLPLMPDP